MVFGAADDDMIAVIEGYASVFGERDLNGDIVERSAFAGSLAKRPAADVKMLYHHAAETPIGRWTDIKEDGRGLFVRGEVFLTVPKGDETFQLVEGGALDGLSIGFRTVRSRKPAGAASRRLIEVELWEVSVVTFPMAPGARITRAVRGAAGGLGPRRSGLSESRTEEAQGPPAHLFAEAVRSAADIIRS